MHIVSVNKQYSFTVLTRRDSWSEVHSWENSDTLFSSVFFELWTRCVLPCWFGMGKRERCTYRCRYHTTRPDIIFGFLTTKKAKDKPHVLNFKVDTVSVKTCEKDQHNSFFVFFWGYKMLFVVRLHGKIWKWQTSGINIAFFPRALLSL